ncbi:MAG: type II toxin-antitoxin system Phd/YefM family antitoxin [Sporichthyaceae bacterium]
MTTVGAYEAKTHLPRLLEAVERGDSITITRHGREIARLVPAASTTVRPAAAIAALRAARRGVLRGEISVKDMVDEGRR